MTCSWLAHIARIIFMVNYSFQNQLFWGLPEKKTCLSQIVRSFSARHLFAGNYGEIMGRNLENRIFLGGQLSEKAT